MATAQSSLRGRSLSGSLTSKIAILAVLVLFLVLLVFAAVFIFVQRSGEKRQILEGGKQFAQFSSGAIYDDYVQFYTQPLPEDFEQFKQNVLTKTTTNENVMSFSLVARNGRVLFDSSEFTAGKYSGSARTIEDERILRAIQGDDLSTIDDVIDGEPVTEIIVPLAESGGGRVLSMRYVISYVSLSRQTTEIARSTLVVAASMMVIVAFTAFLLARRLARPIVQLTHVTEQIRLGNFSVKADETSRDELGRLGRAINSMADSLASYYKDLEAKVRARTKELEATQKQLQENVKQDEALLASIGDGVIATDQSGYVVWLNKTAEEMLQLPKEQIVGKLYDKVWALETEKGDPVPKEQQPLQQAIATGRPVRSAEYYYSRKGTSGKPDVRFAVGLTIAPVTLNDQMLGIVSVFRDVTHERQVDRMKTEFISLASHQLRTPLSAIRWFTEMLLSGDAGKLSAEQEEFSKNIYDSVDRMIALVNSLLNISRIESGRIIVDPKPTDLNELVTGVVNDLKAKIDQRQQTLIVSVHKDLPKVNLDPRLISQVYMNFLTNAIKYTPKGGEISVFVSRKDNDLVSQITDNGYGIPVAQQSRLFEKFFRAENIVKVETDGTGLGLYLVKAIIESSGGKVWFKSEEGKGTTFWFSLPMSGMKAHEGEVTLDA